MRDPGRRSTATRRRMGAAVLALAVGCLWHAAAPATEAIRLDDAELVARSTRIVYADVIGRRALRVPDGRIYTEYRLRIREALKGGGRRGETIVFREWGGSVGDVHYWIPGCGRFEVGQRVIAFLAPVDPHTGVGFTTGLAQGKIHVIDTPRGPEAIRSFGDLTLRTPNGRVHAALPIERRKLDLVLTRIRALVRAGR